VKTLFNGLRAALFDLDGTLIETHIDFAQMKREMLSLVSRYGVDTEPIRGLDVLRLVEAARAHLEAAGRHGEGYRLRLEAFARLEEIEREQCASPVELPGAAQLLAILHTRGVRIGIVTRNCRSVSLRLLRAGNLICDTLVTRDDVPRTKPDPAHLRAALAAMGDETLHWLHSGGSAEASSAPPPIVMVGDHWMDIQAGHAAGVWTVGLLRGRSPDFFAPAPPHLLVNEIADLLPGTETR
jgi:phosphoglycolate phosphatase